MGEHILDNPIWASLVSRHRVLAQRRGDVAWYPPTVAPFLGVAADGVDTANTLESLIATAAGTDDGRESGEQRVDVQVAFDKLHLLGPVPAMPAGWRLDKLAMLAQMVCTAPMVQADGPAIIELTDAHRADLLALTALVYPHYFRPRTMDLGRYFGIYQDGHLAAMAGERMGMDGWQEISAICTHPDFHGRGYARRLLAWLSNDNLARGRTPFLHVSHDNEGAKRLYETGGYRYRPDISFWSLRRIG